MLTTKVSTKGQVTLPKSLRDQLGIKPGTAMQITVENHTIHLDRIRSDWREWEGRYAGTEPNLVRELEQEHRREIERDEERLKRL